MLCWSSAIKPLVSAAHSLALRVNSPPFATFNPEAQQSFCRRHSWHGKRRNLITRNITKAHRARAEKFFLHFPAGGGFEAGRLVFESMQLM